MKSKVNTSHSEGTLHAQKNSHHGQSSMENKLTVKNHKTHKEIRQWKMVETTEHWIRLKKKRNAWNWILKTEYTLSILAIYKEQERIMKTQINCN